MLKVQSLQLSFRPAGVSLGGGEGGARPPSPPPPGYAPETVCHTAGLNVVNLFSDPLLAGQPRIKNVDAAPLHYLTHNALGRAGVGWGDGGSGGGGGWG